jgi:5-methylthioadenosine/S-adenosylhomocysteine deaminase
VTEPDTNAADIVIVNGTILPMGGGKTIRNGVLKIIGDTIAELGSANNFDIATGKKRIDAKGAVVMPGFVNCHTHIASNMLLRGLLEDVQLFEWLSTMWKLKRNFDEETLYCASLMGLVEMARSGITCFNEHFDAYASSRNLKPSRKCRCVRRLAMASPTEDYTRR